MSKFGKTIRQQIDQIFSWTAKPQTNGAKGKPYLTERDGILALHFDRISVQSEMYIDSQDELALDYTRAIMSFLLFDPSPKHIAMIGLGGGSLAKYCYRNLSQTNITVIEINPDVIALRNEFAIPFNDERFKVLLGDGAKYVAAADNQCDVLVVDGFDAGGQSAQLCSQQFYDHCFSSLTDKGIMAVNLWGNDSNHHKYLARIHHSFANRVVVVSTDDSLNKIALAMKHIDFPPSPARIRHHANLLGLSHPLNFQTKSNKLLSALPMLSPLE